MTLTHQLIEQDGTILARFVGSLDESAMSVFDQHVQGIRLRRPKKVIWNFSNVRPLAAAALGRLLQVNNLLQKAGGASVVVLPSWAHGETRGLGRILGRASVLIADSESLAFDQANVSPSFLSVVESDSRAAKASETSLDDAIPDEANPGLIAELQDGLSLWVDRFVNTNDKSGTEEVGEDTLDMVAAGSGSGVIGELKAGIKYWFGNR
jgi:hypothetical protein